MLEGIRVVSLAQNLPGPVACAELRRRGADVIKIEPPTGDPLAADFADWYRVLSGGQAVTRLDLKSPRERERLHPILEKADLLVTASRPAFLKSVGLGWDELHSRHPRLFQVAIVGFPHPNEDQPGHDLTYQAEMGFVSPPHLPRTLFADMAGAKDAVIAALELLLEREREGHRAARCVTVSLSQSLAPFLEPVRFGAVAPGAILGGGHPGYGIYRSLDGWIALAALEDKYWKRVAELLPAASADAARGKHIGLARELERVFSERTSKEWETWARTEGIPLATVKG